MKNTFWDNHFASLPRDCKQWAISDRGWLLAECAPFSLEMRHSYTSDTTPIRDETALNTGWREQSSLGWYMDYGPECHRTAEGYDRAEQPGNVLAHSVVTHASHWFMTCEQAQRWIESQAITGRPDLETP